MAPSAEPLMAAVLLLLAAVPVALTSNVTYTVANDTGLNSSAEPDQVVAIKAALATAGCQGIGEHRTRTNGTRTNGTRMRRNDQVTFTCDKLFAALAAAEGGHKGYGNLTKPNFTDHLPSRASGLKGEREAKMVKSVKYQRAAAHRLTCTVNTKSNTTGNRNRRELKKLPILRIKVHFIVINDGTRKTNVTMKTLAAQVASTNKVLRGIETEDKKNRGKTSAPFDKAVDTRLEIVLAGKPKYVTNKEQHRCMPKNQEAIKAAHASNPTNQVNIIICKTLMNNGKAMLGWSMFPVSKTKLGVPIKPSSNQWGMFIEYKSLPGYNSRYSGDTLTHELGHFFGLYHTFWEGIGTQCKFDNDYKGDTGLTNAPGYGCKKGSRSCPGVTTYDPIWNIMDYSDDACMFSFSEQQGVEMHTQIELHKKDLYKASKKLGETSRLIPFNSAKCLKQWNNGTTVSSKNAAATTNATINATTNTTTNATTGYGRLRRADETTGGVYVRDNHGRAVHRWRLRLG